MKDGVGFGGVVALMALCCGAPLLVVAMSSVSLSAWLANAYYILIPAALLLLGLIAFMAYGRWNAGQARCGPAPNNREQADERLLRHKQ